MAYCQDTPETAVPQASAHLFHYDLSQMTCFPHNLGMTRLLHITPRADWETAVTQGTLQPTSLMQEGFIHCSTLAQVLLPANSLYRGQTDLVLLLIDPTLVPSAIVYEDCYASGQQFPHIYGPLPVTAVVQLFPFPPEADGTFTLPPALQTWREEQ